MLGLGRLTHLALDLIAISTILAGIKRSSGFVPNTDGIKDPALRSFIESYFSVGETVYGMISGFVVNSRYFRRTLKE